MKHNNSGIYIITNLINKKFYLGSSMNLKKRKATHLSTLRNKKHHNKHLQNAWNKYGEKNFEFDIVEYIEDENLLKEVEQFYIDDFKLTKNRKQCYNIANNTQGIFRVGTKVDKKILKGKNNPQSIKVVKVDKYGNVHKEYVGLSEAGRVEGVSESCISECCSGKQKTCKGFAWFFKSYYLKNKEKIDFASFFKRQRERPVIVFDINNNYIGAFPTLRKASEKLNVKEKGVQECCSGRQKTHRGYIFKYLENA